MISEQERKNHVVYIQEIKDECKVVLQYSINTEIFDEFKALHDIVLYMLPLLRDDLIVYDKKIKAKVSDLKVHIYRKKYIEASVVIEQVMTLLQERQSLL